MLRFYKAKEVGMIAVFEIILRPTFIDTSCIKEIYLLQKVIYLFRNLGCVHFLCFSMKEILWMKSGVDKSVELFSFFTYIVQDLKKLLLETLLKPFYHLCFFLSFDCKSPTQVRSVA